MRRRTSLALAVGVLCAGCAASAHTPPPATLSAAAVPYLPSSARALTGAQLAREAGTPALASELHSWGFQAGAQRYFQGESRRLQVVDSRTLRFRAADGAKAMIGFVRSHISTYLGSFPRLRALGSAGRQGFVAIGQPCQCHLANPAFLAVLGRGGTVSWLEINGPGATLKRLRALLAQAP